MATQDLQVELNVIVQATPERVLHAFFDPGDLATWWQVVRSVTVARPLGMYAVEWDSTDFRDEVLGRLGGAFHGTVMDFRAGEEFFVADAYWTPPDGDPIGPMALVVTVAPQSGGHITRLDVRQSGDADGVRWQRYFEIVAAGWQRALGELKAHLDRESLRSRR
jgi:uncharacterized protein YndB with AHSA1/START domain